MTLSLVLRARMSSEEFWLRTRKAYRERQKAKKNSFQTKEEYLASDFYKMKVARRARAEKWKDIDKNTFSWNTPTIALDLSYAEDMTEKERRSASSQVLHLYGALRTHSRPLKVYLTSVVGEMQKLLSKHSGFNEWKVFTSEKSFYEVFDKKDLVYLSPESPNVLTEIDHAKVYVIGGLVDHNRLKGLSFEKAQKLEIAHARLPLQEIRPDFVFSSLNPNHVFEIISDVAAGVSWDDTLENRVPRRQGYRPDYKRDKRKTPSQSANSESDTVSDDESRSGVESDREEPTTPKRDDNKSDS